MVTISYSMGSSLFSSKSWSKYQSSLLRQDGMAPWETEMSSYQPYSPVSLLMDAETSGYWFGFLY